jgi:predicted ATPase
VDCGAAQPRPPALYVLNEPETSLHPDLLPPLADLVARASRQAQVVAVTHSTVLRDALEAAEPDLQLVRLVKELGETAVEDQGRLERPPWQWPSR